MTTFPGTESTEGWIRCPVADVMEILNLLPHASAAMVNRNISHGLINSGAVLFNLRIQHGKRLVFSHQLNKCAEAGTPLLAENHLIEHSEEILGFRLEHSGN